ncbi:hypothetical protein V8F20_004404 [Naviculisporaceae sp. PSN 640]
MGEYKDSPTAALAAAVFSPIPSDTRQNAFALFHGDNDDGGATPTVSKAKSSFSGRIMLPLTPHPNAPLLSPQFEDPDTPSSTRVEFGEGEKQSRQLSAAELAETVYRSYALSTSPEPEEPEREPRKQSPEPPRPKPRPDSRSRRQERRARGDSPSPKSVISISSSSKGRSQSANCRPTKSIKASLREILLDSRLNDNDKPLHIQERDIVNTKVNRFLSQMSQQEPGSAQKELLMENRSLYERINTLQRMERELLAENQDLISQFQSLRKHHEMRRQQWREEHEMRDKAFQARINQLKEQIAQQETQMLQMQRTQTYRTPPLLSDGDILSWFSAKDASWHAWAQENAFRDSSPLSSRLHPLQLGELCRGVQNFVNLTDAGELPDEVMAGGPELGSTLLHGMLVNFICNEALSSPFWIFGAMSAGNVESPSIPEPTSNSPVGFRMDLALWNQITPKRLSTFATTPGAPLFPPPLAHSMVAPLSINTSAPVGLPQKAEMENLHHMLAKAQGPDADITVHHWRAQTMRLFAESGLVVKSPHDPSVNKNESARLLVETRLNHARKLKERFLGGAARFLLKDQDAAGIERLERRLTDEIDSALRFGCKIWSRSTPLRLQGLCELGGQEFKSASNTMELCHAQAPPQSEEALLNPETPPPGYYDGRKVLMVVQPAIESTGIDLDVDEYEDLNPKMWLKARVVVSLSTAPAPPESDTPAPEYEKVQGRAIALRLVTDNRGEAGPLAPKGFALKLMPDGIIHTPVEKTKPIEILAPTAFNPLPFGGNVPKFSLTAATPNSATSQASKVSFSV